MDYIYIDNIDEFFASFEDPKHFMDWLIELHEEVEIEEIEELKQATLDLSLDIFYLICKEFEQKYLHL